MQYSSKKITGEQKDIREIIDHCVNVNLKISKTDVTAKLSEGILPAGTVVNKTGKPATEADAFGIIFEDVNFKNSTGTEVVPVLVHGFVSKAKIKESVGTDIEEAIEKALNLIKFI